MNEVMEAIEDISRIYHKEGFRVRLIHADPEFKSIEDKLWDKHRIKMNCCNRQDHVPLAERNHQRSIKERCRMNFHQIPFTILPRLMVKMLVLESTKKLNQRMVFPDFTVQE